MRKVACLGLVAALAGCAPPRRPEPPPLSIPDRIAVQVNGRVTSVAFEDYVLGSILAEVVPANEALPVAARIYEVQAVVARSYALSHLGRHRSQGFDLCATTHCQVYEPSRIRSSRFAPVAREAVRRTSSQVLSFGRRPIDAVFHADCGGATAAADAVWGGAPVPYLPAHEDDVEVAHRSWRVELSAEQLRAALNKDARTAVGARLDALSVDSRDASGRAAVVSIRGERRLAVRGEDLRAALNQALGGQRVLSTRFDIERTGRAYALTGSGFGHGVGMCQVGAAARARRGDSLLAIVGAYYPGARVVTLDR